jgi:hypothetical protein
MVDAEDVIRVTLENLKAEGTEVTPAQEKMVRDTVHRWLVLIHAEQQDRKLAVWGGISERERRKMRSAA